PLADPASTPGHPNSDKPVHGMGDPIDRVKRTWPAPDETAVRKVLPAGQAFADTTQTNNGFFVLAPDVKFLPNADPGFTAVSAKSPNMSFGVKVDDDTAGTPPKPTIILQRLANPAL